MSCVHQSGEKRKIARLEAMSVVSNTDSNPKLSLSYASPYTRIFSKANVYAHNLPNFLLSSTHKKGITMQDLRRMNLLSLKTYSPENLPIENLELKISKVLDYLAKMQIIRKFSTKEVISLKTQILSTLNDPGFELTINIKNLPISFIELKNVLSEKDLSKNIVNTMMQYFKKINRISHKRKILDININIASVDFSDSILVHGRINSQVVFDFAGYDFFVFPIFHHY